jgi:radical SAM superfamily enzyme YgiQ (UPF0313 family)
MDVLLIRCAPDSDALPTSWAYPIGISYVAGALRAFASVDAKVVDEIVSPLTDARIRELVVGRGACLVGLSVHSFRGLPRAREIAKAVKRANACCHVVIGGDHPTATAEALLSEAGPFDSVARGEGEYLVGELYEALACGAPLETVSGLGFRRDGQVILTPPRPLVEDLDQLPGPAWDLLPSPAEYSQAESQVTAVVVGSRGCRHRCTFCSTRVAGPRRRSRSPAAIVDELAHLVDRWSVERVRFADPSFFDDPDWVRELSEMILSRGLDFTYCCSARADDILACENLLPLAHKAGLRKIEMGVESASDRTLRSFRKGVSVAQTRSAIKLLSHHGIQVEVGFIMFEPHSTLADLRENMEFLQEIGAYAVIMLTALILYPGSECYRQSEADGILRGSVHDPSYRFQRAKIQALWDALKSIESRVMQCAGRLSEVGVRIVRQSPSEEGRKRQLLRGMHVHALNRLVYRAFGDAVAFAESHEEPECTAEALSRVLCQVIDGRLTSIAQHAEALCG